MSATRMPRGERGLDFYATPAWCVEALLPHLPRGRVLDPCCGDGAILRVVADAWKLVEDEVYGIELDEVRAAEAARRLPRSEIARENALAVASWPCGYGLSVVMNPPYTFAEAFVRRALAEIAPGGTVAALLRLGFLEGQARAAFHRAHPADVLVLPRRPSFTGRGTDASAYAWFVWGPGRGGRWSLLDVEAAR
jgi:hypothetical protein